MIKPDGIGKVTVHCRSVEHLNDQRKRRNAISKDAGFLPPLITQKVEQPIMDALYETQQSELHLEKNYTMFCIQESTDQKQPMMQHLKVEQFLLKEIMRFLNLINFTIN